jgi:hypothetical protein
MKKVGDIFSKLFGHWENQRKINRKNRTEIKNWLNQKINGGFGGFFFLRNHWRIQNDSPYSDVTGSPFKLPTDSPKDLKWQIRTVTCWCFRQNHRQSFRRWNCRKKLIYDISADPLLPYFSFFFLIPTLPICKQPPPQKKKSPSYQYNKLIIFLEVLWSQYPCSDVPTDFINFCK